MPKSHELKFGPIGNGAVHICVDMQRMYAEDTEWRTPWFDKVLPNVMAIVEAKPERTIFTRFIPAKAPGQGCGAWRRYYERWSNMTIEQLGLDLIDIIPSLSRFVPPARVFDKFVYSPWIGTDLHRQLNRGGLDTIIVTGGETDVCVLSSVLGAVDWGFRVILVTDALCSSSDATHDAMMEIYMNRFGQQIETVPTEMILGCWVH